MQEERMNESKFRSGCAYYRLHLVSESKTTSPNGVVNRPRPAIVIETWYYQGYYEFKWNTTSCDVPHYFHVFQPFVRDENVLDRPSEQGLRMPSLQGAELSMLTLDELIVELQGGQSGIALSQNDATGPKTTPPTNHSTDESSDGKKEDSLPPSNGGHED
jgi:hypothetical protein